MLSWHGSTSAASSAEAQSPTAKSYAALGGALLGPPRGGRAGWGTRLPIVRASVVGCQLGRGTAGPKAPTLKVVRKWGGVGIWPRCYTPAVLIPWMNAMDDGWTAEDVRFRGCIDVLV